MDPRREMIVARQLIQWTVIRIVFEREVIMAGMVNVEVERFVSVIEGVNVGMCISPTVCERTRLAVDVRVLAAGVLMKIDAGTWLGDAHGEQRQHRGSQDDQLPAEAPHQHCLTTG